MKYDPSNSGKCTCLVNKSGRIHADNTAALILIFYVLILLPSTLILMTKLASISGLSWVDALFTATSALTVTGLGVVNIGDHFSALGQIWLLALMQIGGLGQMTLSFVLLLSLGKQIGLKQQALIREELNQGFGTDMLLLIKSIVIFAVIVETIGAFVLAISWVPQFGWAKGFYYAIFHAISSFNNAGFSLFANSMSEYSTNPLVSLTIPALFIIGGLGFTVVIDLLHFSRRPQKRRLNLHSKLVLSVSAGLLIGGTVVLYLLESNNPKTLAAFSQGEKLLIAFFQAATARTAGFNSINIIDMSNAGLLVMITLMFIGAGSTSTGGGIKVCTFAVAVIATKSFLQNKKTFSAFKRNIAHQTVLKSLSIIVISFMVLLSGTFLLMITENARFDVVLFESVSAFSTVGLTAGLTENLSETGKLIMIFLMIVGRIGPLTLAYVVTRPKPNLLRYSDAEVIVG